MTTATPASTAVRMVSAIPESLLIIMEAALQSDRYDTYPASYCKVARGIINEILRSMRVSNEIESLRI